MAKFHMVEGFSPMISPITEELFIGKARLAYNTDILSQAKIGSVVKLFESPPNFSDSFTVLDMPIPDGVFLESDKLSCTDQFIADEIGAGRRVLSVCGAGVSRSATVMLSYLVTTGMGLKEAYLLVKSKRHLIAPHPALWESLIVHHDLDLSLQDVLGWGSN